MKAAALVSTILVLPFLILEAVNTTLTRENAQGLVVLFGVLWAVPLLFVLLLRAHGWLAVRVVVMIALAVFWGSLVIDQMPCFLGVPNCD